MESWGRTPCVVLSTDLANAKAVVHDPQVLCVDTRHNGPPRAPGATMLHMERVGIRELRLNASRLMSRVERGESLEVTSRGRLVARIVPVRPAGGLAQLLAEGAATPPEEEGDLLDIPAVEPVPGAPLPSQVLAEMRADER